MSHDSLYVLTFVFFNDTATTEIYTLSLHDALPICCYLTAEVRRRPNLEIMTQTMLRQLQFDGTRVTGVTVQRGGETKTIRSEEHTSELQSRQYLVCRLLLEKKKKHLLKERSRNTEV